MKNVNIASKIAQVQEGKKLDLDEKLFKNGASFLSDRELMAILLHRATNSGYMMHTAKKVLECIDRDKTENVELELRKIKGLTDAQISLVIAAFELGRRFHSQEYGQITKPIEVLPYIKHYAFRKTEHFICISLSGANEIINIRAVSSGTLTNTLVHPREVFADVIADRAASVIFAHNHPSGNVEPSSADIDLTYRLTDVADLLGIDVLDHIIFSQRDNFVSLAERGIIEERETMSDLFARINPDGRFDERIVHRS